MKRFLTRGPKEGRCNICGEFGQLTEDHTPPKGSVRVTQMEVNHLTSVLGADRPGPKPRISQNGVKFRTLCKRCNNSALGLNCDLAFNDFTQGIKSYLTSSIKLPSVMYVSGKPGKIARAVFGHLSAVGVDRFHEGDRSDEMMEWFLDESLPMPSRLRIKYWVYPYKTQILIRDSAIRDLRAQDAAVFWLMKFFPVAFLVLWDSPSGYEYPQFADLARWGNADPEAEIELPIYLNSVPHERWPEAPEDHSFLLYGEGAVAANARIKRRS